MPVLSLRSASSVAGSMSASGSSVDIVHLAVVNTIPSASSNHQNHMVKYSRQASLQNVVNEVAQKVLGRLVKKKSSKISLRFVSVCTGKLASNDPHISD